MAALREGGGASAVQARDAIELHSGAKHGSAMPASPVSDAAEGERHRDEVAALFEAVLPC